VSNNPPSVFRHSFTLPWGSLNLLGRVTGNDVVALASRARRNKSGQCALDRSTAIPVRLDFASSFASQLSREHSGQGVGPSDSGPAVPSSVPLPRRSGQAVPAAPPPAPVAVPVATPPDHTPLGEPSHLGFLLLLFAGLGALLPALAFLIVWRLRGRPVAWTPPRAGRPRDGLFDDLRRGRDAGVGASSRLGAFLGRGAGVSMSTHERAVRSLRGRASLRLSLRRSTREPGRGGAGGAPRSVSRRQESSSSLDRDGGGSESAGPGTAAPGRAGAPDPAPAGGDGPGASGGRSIAARRGPAWSPRGSAGATVAPDPEGEGAVGAEAGAEIVSPPPGASGRVAPAAADGGGDGGRGPDPSPRPPPVRRRSRGVSFGGALGSSGEADDDDDAAAEAAADATEIEARPGGRHAPSR